MKRISKKELELRKWALELSLNHWYNFFAYDGTYQRVPKDIINGAKAIINLITDDWNKPTSDFLDKDNLLILEKNQ